VTVTLGNGSPDPHKQLLEHVNLTIGICAGCFGSLTVVAFALLPADTGTEKFLIVLASLACSVACFTGVGAWRSRRRFFMTATLLAVALLATAGLSKAAESAGAAAARRAKAEAVASTPPIGTGTSPAAAGGGSGTSPSATESSSPSTSTTPTPSTASHGKPVCLTELPSVSNDLLQGQWRIGKTVYSHSLGYKDVTSATAEYRLGGKFRRLTGVFAMDEDASDTENATLSIALDGQDAQEWTTGPFHPANVDVDVTGATRLHIEISTETNWGTLALFGKACLDR
jgi:hypothetical protein